MTRLATLVLFFALVAFSVPAVAQAPADNAIRGAVADLDRFEKQAAGFTSRSKSGISRTLKLLSLTEQRLNSSPNSADPSWIAANQRLQNLKGRLTALRDGTATPPPAASTPAPAVRKKPVAAQPKPAPAVTPAAQADPSVGRAQRELRLMSRQIGTMRQGDPRMTARFMRDLDRIGQTLGASPDKGKPSWNAVAAEHKAVVGRLVEGRAAVLGQSLTDFDRKLGATNAVQFQQAGPVKKLRDELGQIGADKDKLNAPDHPAVADLSARIAQTKAQLDAKVADAKSKLDAMGDVFGKMNKVAQAARSFPVPKELNSGVVTQDRVKDYLKQAIAAETVATKALPFLRGLNGKVAMNVNQSNFYRRLMGNLEARPQQIRRSLDISTAHIDSGLKLLDHTIDFVGKTDPADVNHQQRFLGENDTYNRTIKELEQGLDQVAAAALFDKTVKRKNGPDRAAQKAKIEQALVDFRAKYQTVLKTIRMPKATSDDERLLAAATALLKSQKDFGGFERMVINYGPQKKEKTTSDIDLKATSATTVTGTATTYHYVWEEFQTTTAEKVGNDYVIFANRFRKYEKGATNTPIGKWILSGRFKTNRIPKENIHKD